MTSKHFFALEKRCKKMRKIKIIKIVLIVFAFGMSVLNGYYYFWKHNSTTSVPPLLNKQDTTNVPQEALVPEIIQELNEQRIIPEEKEKENEKYDTLFLEAKIRPSDTSLINEAHEEKMLLKHYASEQTFDTAYAVAFFYFEAKEYVETMQWAQKARYYNPEDVKSWLLYAKASFYRGERKKAMDALELFLKSKDSKEARELLNFYKGQE